MRVDQGSNLKLTVHRFASHPNDESNLEIVLLFSVLSLFVFLVVKVYLQLPLVLSSRRALLAFSVSVWFLRLVPWITFSCSISPSINDIPILYRTMSISSPISPSVSVCCEALNQRPSLRTALQSTRRVQLHSRLNCNRSGRSQTFGSSSGTRQCPFSKL